MKQCVQDKVNKSTRETIKLKEEIKHKFSEILDLINENKFDRALRYLDDSPAGDYTGCDNRYIAFSYGDIGDMIDRLKYLHEFRKKNIKSK